MGKGYVHLKERLSGKDLGIGILEKEKVKEVIDQALGSYVEGKRVKLIR